MQKTKNKTGASHRKPDIKKLVVVVVLGLIIFYFAYTLISQQISLNKKNNEIKALESQVQTAKDEAKKLEEEIDNLKDPEYIEKIARDKLGFVKPNERVFVDSNKSENNNGN